MYSLSSYYSSFNISFDYSFDSSSKRLMLFLKIGIQFLKLLSTYYKSLLLLLLLILLLELLSKILTIES